ncbi:MAG TPA: VOC family protein [Gemmatimonadaceae bacterium]|nr:VOC family protein [Gemmatimonadaceae bacterium]
MLLGLRTVIYKVSDLDRAKEWYSATFGVAPYFDESFYVGFNIGGFELGLDPSIAKQGPGPGGALAYWGVRDLKGLLADLTAKGVRVRGKLQNVGDGILVASIEDPFGNLIGLIENPHFTLAQESHDA